MIPDSSLPASIGLPHAPPVAPDVVMLSGARFVAGCGIAAAGLLLLGRTVTFPLWLLPVEVLATILGLFLLGSFTYQIHKNALTYGMLLIVIATFCGLDSSPWHVEVAVNGWWWWIRAHVLSFHGLDELIHVDTMLFILGLTLFVLAIVHLFAMAQIAGYAVGGCWTHIESAQSVVAYSFIRREVDERYTPLQWIKDITPVIAQIAVLLTILIYLESALLNDLP